MRCCSASPVPSVPGCSSSTSKIGGFAIPSTFFQMLPYVITLVVVAGALGRAVAPAAEGTPYERSR